VAIIFGKRADGAVIADFSKSLNEGDLDTLAIAAIPGLSVGAVIRFAKDKDISRTMQGELLAKLENGSVAVANGVAEYEVVAIDPTEYTVKRLAT
jgi:hypothetical protein